MTGPVGLEGRVLWRDGALVPAAEATVTLLAHSLQRGTLVFDVYAVVHHGDRPFGVGAVAHTERFLRSAKLLGFEVDRDVDELLTIAGTVVAANPGCDSVRLMVLSAEPSLTLTPTGAPTLAVAAYAVADVHERHGPERPGRVQVGSGLKVPDAVLPVQAKVAASYAPAALALARARADGFDDVLLLGAGGGAAEAGTMSFFAVADGCLLVAALDEVLDGITRRIVLELAEDENVPARVGPIALPVLERADEAFLASTSRNIWPIGVLGGRELVEPVPGPVTTLLDQRLAALLDGSDPLAGRWLTEL